MIISHMPSGTTIYFGLFNAVLRHDINVQIDHVSQSFPHLIFKGFNNKLGERSYRNFKIFIPCS